MRSSLVGIAAALMGCASWTAVSSAAFISGIESFPGTVKDAATWEEFTSGGGVIAQNNSLNIASTGGNSDYTTITQLINVGDFVRADVTVNSVGDFGSAALYLTNDSGGTGARTADDSRLVGIRYGNSADAIQAAVQRGAGGDTYTNIVNGDHPVGTTYTYEITLDSTTSATFKVFDGVTQLGSTLTLSPLSPFGDLPGSMFISLVAGGSDVTFDNVMINQVPEPGTAGMLLMLAAGLIIQRRRNGAAVLA